MGNRDSVNHRLELVCQYKRTLNPLVASRTKDQPRGKYHDSRIISPNRKYAFLQSTTGLLFCRSCKSRTWDIFLCCSTDLESLLVYNQG